MTLYKWSQTASADANADSTINWAEGQAPSSVNDSARAMMAAIAKYRDDIAGAIVTSGTSSAYALNTYQVFQSLSQMNGQVVAFTPHTTNSAAVTFNVDALGSKPLRSAPNVELPAGVLIQGTPYLTVYSNADSAFYLQGFFGNPYNLPVGGSLDFWGSTPPNSSFALMYGQALSRSTYSTLFAQIGTAYGAGDGTTTFNIPDVRGRVIAGSDIMGGPGAGRLTMASGMSGTGIGAVGGAETKTLATANLPPYTPSGTISNGSITVTTTAGGFIPSNSGTIISNSAPSGAFGSTGGLSALQGTSTFSGSAQGGTSAAFAVVQPTIVANKILRVI